MAKNFISTAQNSGFTAIAGSFSAFLFVPGVLVVVTTAVAMGWGDFHLGARLFCLGLLTAGASTVCGWMLGLLFGIPRTLARPSPPGAASAPSATGNVEAGSPVSRVNTNLEDVSDWLSKTIVGVGLTQLTSLPHFLWHSAQALNDQGFGWTPYGQLYGLLLFLYFGPGGFWLSYITTRTTLTKLFDQYADPKNVEQALKPDQLNISIAGRGIAPASDPGVAAADRMLLPLRLTDLSSNREVAAWSFAKARSGDLAAAVTGLREALQADPDNAQYRDALGKVLLAQGEKSAASQILNSEAPTDTNVLAALYEPKPGGYERAIKIGEALLIRPDQKANYRLRVWLACAYGQKHADLIQQASRDEAKIEAARKRVADLVEEALGINPNVKAWVRSLWKPVGDSLDDDLKSIPADDPDFSRLLN